MAKTINFTVTAKTGKLWAWVQPRCGNPDAVPINHVLRWALEQINFEQWGYTLDEKGYLESLTMSDGDLASDRAARIDRHLATYEELTAADRRDRPVELRRRYANHLKSSTSLIRGFDVSSKR